MKIAVIGTGNVGSVLGRRWALGGHTVVFGSREPQGDKVQALVKASGAGASAASEREAAAAADVVLLAVPWHVATNVAASLGDVRGKVLIDATNPLALTFRGRWALRRRRPSRSPQRCPARVL